MVDITEPQHDRETQGRNSFSYPAYSFFAGVDDRFGFTFKLVDQMAGYSIHGVKHCFYKPRRLV